ncbi:hypothetical protein B9Z55_012623 [Caenorhabditis nigoni]|nr:hypothetical protein B9Z55_012623 [Caenorhabditis nigoni]
MYFSVDQFCRSDQNFQLSETQQDLKILANTDSNFNDYSIQSEQDLLEQVKRGINQEFYKRVMPEVVCKEKVRIGEKSDGGKYVYKPQAVNQEDCTKSGKSKVDVLKIDIEGGEHTGLEPLIKDYSVCQDIKVLKQ